jgi:hypothetical protein
MAQEAMGESPTGVMDKMNYIKENNGMPEDDIGFKLTNDPAQLPTIPEQENNVKLLTEKIAAAEDDPTKLAEAKMYAEKMNLPMTSKEMKEFSDAMVIAKKADDSALESQKAATTFFEELKKLNDVEAKYERLRKTVTTVNEKSIEMLRKRSEKYGITPDDMEYDLWSSRELRERNMYVYDQISDKSGEEIWSTLTSMRLLSPGTGKAILTSNIIDDLIDDSIISKQEGAYLKKLELTGTTEKYVSNAEKLAAAAAGTKKASKATKPTWKAFTFKAPAKITPPKIKALPKSTLPKIRFTTAV